MSFAGFYIDPAVCDSCLHLSAVQSCGEALAEGVPVSCQAVKLPGRSRPNFPIGSASAVPGSTLWNADAADSKLAVLDLVSKAIRGAALQQPHAPAVDKVGLTLYQMAPLQVLCHHAKSKAEPTVTDRWYQSAVIKVLHLVSSKPVIKSIETAPFELMTQPCCRFRN